MTDTTELIARLLDLHKQATEERSHYYVGKCVRDAADALEAQAREIADCNRLRDDERLTWDAQHKRQASMNAHLAELVTDAQEELRKCQQDAIQLQARLAEAERNEETLLGMIRHQRDVLRECLPYINESMAGRRPGRSADDIRAAVKALTSDSAPAVYRADLLGMPCKHCGKSFEDHEVVAGRLEVLCVADQPTERV